VQPHIQQFDHAVDLLALHRANPQRYPYLLQSVAHGATSSARFDILFAFPGETIRLDHIDNKSSDFLEQLDRAWQTHRRDKSLGASALPFSGGWFLYLGYELAGQVEPSLNLPQADDGLPMAFAARVPAAVLVDHEQQKTVLITESDHEDLLDKMAADLEGMTAFADSKVHVVTELQEEKPTRYLQGIDQVKQYIVDGDVFQVNLSRKWHGELSESVKPANIYQRLCEKNPAPFAGMALINDVAIISSSPERLVRVANGRMETRPIAGTRPRSGNEADDNSLQQELLAHPKERAEHIMLIDLERNDLGRVCVPGSMEVDELMVVESYAHVHHIVSNVRGRLRDGITPGQVIRAVFPGGTITGCPKVRCMEIIAELEGEGRGAYTGSMGYLNHDGSMDLNILIRTITQKGRHISLRAGAGIVADSIPEKELDETRAKARGLLLALS
jgi:anthranilate synthase component 1